jgi:hypothetical protein
MTGQSFSLIPFSETNVPDISIQGKIHRQNNVLAIHYMVRGNIEDILLPSPSINPTRKEELWTTTCLEFFLAVKDSPEYWEFNFSPSGDWNIYHIDTYRRNGFREEMLIQRLQFEPHKNMSSFFLNAAVDLNSIIRVEQILEAKHTGHLRIPRQKRIFTREQVLS